MASSSQASTSSTPQAEPSKAAEPSAESKSTAEKHKQAGNAQMSSKNYEEAIDSYSKAIELDSTNAVYYSNRAAAYSSKNDHLSAIADAAKAIEVDPSFTKAYHRLGQVCCTIHVPCIPPHISSASFICSHAHYCLADYKEAATAFKQGLEIDPTNASLTSALSNAEARITNDELPSSTAEDSARTPDGPAGGLNLDSMADLMSNMGADAGGPAGLAGLMNNPAMMQMAQQLMGNGGLERLMQNPALANMVSCCPYFVLSFS
jgi:small glutamine-rich tetratricopeptide repeat-containing protein alpha